MNDSENLKSPASRSLPTCPCCGRPPEIVLWYDIDDGDVQIGCANPECAARPCTAPRPSIDAAARDWRGIAGGGGRDGD